MKQYRFISKRVQEVRIMKDLSRKEFGDRIGVTGDYIRMLEKGTKNPSEGLLLAMCYRFKVNEGWLKTGTKSRANGSRVGVADFAG